MRYKIPSYNNKEKRHLFIYGLKDAVSSDYSDLNDRTNDEL
jgi:hypothetical protein